MALDTLSIPQCVAVLQRLVVRDQIRAPFTGETSRPEPPIRQAPRSPNRNLVAS